MNTEKLISSNVWKFYLITALGIRFIAPIRILYLLSFGLSFAQIGLMELSAAIVIIILEIPTGIFADMVGRKASRLIAYFFSITAFSIMSFGSTLPVFVLGWSLSGAADAFQSGAQDALIFDTLKYLKREGEYLKVKSHFVLINAASVIVGSLAGAWLYTINPRLPWYLITITIISSALIFLTIKEPPIFKQGKSFSGQLKLFNKSLTTTLANYRVSRLILLGLILALPMYVFTTLLSQPYLISRGFSVPSLGIVFAIITGVSGLAASFSHRIELILRQKLSFLLVILSFTILLVMMGVTHTYLTLILLIGFYIVENFKNIVIDNYLNQAIDSQSRATVLSVQSLANNLFISMVFVFIGYLVDIFSIDTVLILMGLFVGVTCLPLWYFFRLRTGD